MDNTVNDLHHEIKFGICMENKYNFFVKQNISVLFKTKVYIFFILRRVFFQIPKNLIASAFLAKVNTKKCRCALAKSLTCTDFEGEC